MVPQVRTEDIRYGSTAKGARCGQTGRAEIRRVALQAPRADEVRARKPGLLPVHEMQTGKSGPVATPCEAASDRSSWRKMRDLRLRRVSWSSPVSSPGPGDQAFRD